jgi:hypothetical protein
MPKVQRYSAFVLDVYLKVSLRQWHHLDECNDCSRDKTESALVVSAENLGGGDVHTRLSGGATTWRRTTCTRCRWRA